MFSINYFLSPSAFLELTDNKCGKYYLNCKSEVIFKQEPAIPAFENPFSDDLQDELLSVFRSCHAPLVDWSELINDDNKNYQVWLISKESDPDRESNTKITVFFDSKNKRNYMRLFHLKN